MSPEALTALKDSIAHWRRMATGNENPHEGPRGTQCALCREFPECAGCPVACNTGLSQCEMTPYFAAYNAWSRFGSGSVEFREAAQKELDFLISLLPAGESAE